MGGGCEGGVESLCLEGFERGLGRAVWPAICQSGLRPPTSLWAVEHITTRSMTALLYTRLSTACSRVRH